MSVDQLECIDNYGEDTCHGAVEYRMSLSASGKPFPRCDAHWDARLDREEDYSDRYGDPFGSYSGAVDGFGNCYSDADPGL